MGSIQKFNVGQRVFGSTKSSFKEETQDYDILAYEGVIITDFKDDSYLVKQDNGKEVLVELYDFGETMNLYVKPTVKTFLKDVKNYIGYLGYMALNPNSKIGSMKILPFRKGFPKIIDIRMSKVDRHDVMGTVSYNKTK